MENKDFVESLRMLADFYETHPNCQMPDCGVFGEMKLDCLHGKDKMDELVKEFGECGTRKDEPFFLIEKKFGKMRLIGREFLANVCTKKVTGTKKVMQKIATEFEEKEVEEDIVEWECAGTLVSK